MTCSARLLASCPQSISQTRACVVLDFGLWRLARAYGRIFVADALIASWYRVANDDTVTLLESRNGLLFGHFCTL